MVKKYAGQRVLAKINAGVFVGRVERVDPARRLLLVVQDGSEIGRWVKSQNCKITYCY